MVELGYRDPFAAKGRSVSAGSALAMNAYLRTVSESRELGALPRKARRVRRLTYRQAEKQAGRPPSSIIDRPNGEREFTFGQSNAELNEWDLDLGTHPPKTRQ